jgi:endonuclease YncB( thermonuclease family)
VTVQKRDPYIRACRFVTAHDADTQRYLADLGFGLYALLDVRLAGLNAPEVVGEQRAAGLAATAWARDWLELHSGHATTSPTEYPLTLDTSKTEKYGRWLGVVSCARGHVLNADLLAGGYAVPWDGSGPRP